MSLTYPRNISFQCTKCALCCGDTNTRTRHIRLLEFEAKSIGRATSKPIEEFSTRTRGCAPYIYEMRKTAEDGKCIFLAENQCTIYAVRPLICRFYPFELRTEKRKSEFSYSDECPGISKSRRRMLKKSYFDQLYFIARDLLDEDSKV